MNYNKVRPYTKYSLIIIFAAQILAFVVTYYILKAFDVPVTWQNGVGILIYFILTAMYRFWKLKSREIKS